MNVLMLGWELPPSISGGLGVACDGLLRELGRRGDVNVTFVLPAHSVAPGSYPEGVDIVDLGEGWHSESLTSDAAGARCSYVALAELSHHFADGMEAVLARVRPFDVIHAHDWMTFEAARQVKRISGKKVVAHLHSTEHDRVPAGRGNGHIESLEREGLRDADKIVAVSRYTRDLAAERYGQAIGRFEVIHNGTGEAGPIVDAAERMKLIAFVGRVTAQKGPERFLQAAYLLWRSRPELRFVMAGDGDLLPLIKSMAASLGMSEVIQFTGFIDRAAVSQLLHDASVFVMPSLSEPFGLVALEAIRCGVPTVISSRCGLAECIDSVITVDPEDVGGITGACLRLLDDAGFARKLSSQAWHQSSSLNWSRAVDQLVDVYAQMIAVH